MPRFVPVAVTQRLSLPPNPVRVRSPLEEVHRHPLNGPGYGGSILSIPERGELQTGT